MCSKPFWAGAGSAQLGVGRRQSSSPGGQQVPAGVPRPILALLGAGGDTLTFQKAFLKTQSSGFDNFSQQTPVRLTGVNLTLLS